MSTSWSQKDTKRKTIEPFIEKAKALKPELYHKTIEPVSAVFQDTEIQMREFYEQGFGRNDEAVLDLGSHYVGYLTLILDEQGGPSDAPAFFKIKMAEHIRELEDDSAEYDGWIGKGWLQEEWIHIDEFPVTLKLPRRYAFRYLQITMFDTSPNYKMVVKKVEFDTVTSAKEDSVKLIDSEDDLIRKIDEVSLCTLRDCMLEVFEDGPKRDRRLWIGDLRLQALVNYKTFKNYDLVKRCLYLFAGLVREDGAVGSCLYAEPRLLVDNIFLLDYSLFFVPILLDYYNATGDRDTLIELAATAFRQLELAKDYIQANGIIEPEGRYSCFIDWKDELHKQTAMQGVWLYALNEGIKICQMLEEDQQKVVYERWYEEGKQAALTHLWDQDEKCFVSGQERQKSWASQIWLCTAKVLNDSDSRELLCRMAESKSMVGITTPYLFHHYVQVLIDCGEKEKVLAEIKRYWGGMIKEGADTFWELYDPLDSKATPYGSNMVNSYCHAWSCTPAYFLRILKM